VTSFRSTPFRKRLRYWIVPRRLASGVRVRQHTWVQWFGRRWHQRWIESNEAYLERKRRYEAWKATGFKEFPPR
jgi:hypothetical protein